MGGNGVLRILRQHFQRLFEPKAEELENLHSKNAADNDLFWQQRHHEFLAANNLDKETRIAATQSRLNRRIETLQAEAEVLNEEVFSDNVALNAKVGDEEFLQLMAIDSDSREEWLTRRDERIRARRETENFASNVTSLRRSVEESFSVHWLPAEEYSKQQDMNVNSELRSSQMMILYEDYEGSSIIFNFDSNKVWAELAELRHDEEDGDEQEQERILLQERYQQDLRELAQRRRSEKRARRAEVSLG